MKAGIIYIAIFAAALFIIPLAIPGPAKRSGDTAPQTETIEKTEITTPADTLFPPAILESLTQSPALQTGDGLYANDDDAESAVSPSPNGVASFMVLDESTGKVSEISLRDFVRGAVAAEMPVSFHTEALKAQAVAAHTFALYNHYAQQENPDPALMGADFSADPSNMKVYIIEETAREFYGEDYADVYWDKICEAADSVLMYIMEYGDSPIAAAYHAISAGTTEDASNVWSGEAAYLKPVKSSGDYLAPDYEVATEFTEEDTMRMILSAYPDTDLSGEPGGWFSDIERSESGYVTAVTVGGTELRGTDIRTLFGLRSHNIDIFYGNGRFTFVTYGYGHGVGLSQYGADFMARQGYTYDAILEHYYTGVIIRQIEINANTDSYF